MPGYLQRPEAGHVVETLLDQQFADADFHALAGQWLLSNMQHASWSITAIKFVLAMPAYSVSQELAAELARRVRSLPNQGCWHRYSADFSTQAARANQPAIRELCEAVSNREQAPAWELAAELMRTCSTATGSVIRFPAGKKPGNVQLEIGLLAVWPSQQGSETRRSDCKQFYILSVNPAKGRVVVSDRLLEPLSEGQECSGQVCEVKNFGVFVIVNGQSGLLHHSRCGDFQYILATYPVGSDIPVRVVRVTVRGPELEFAGDLPASTSGTRISVGSDYSGTVISVAGYGLFIDIGGTQGLLHRSRCRNFPELVKDHPVGSSIDVRVVELTAKGAALDVSGGMASTNTAVIEIGSCFDGVVTNIVDYGVFVDFGVMEGLLHRSQLPEGADPHALFTRGQMLQVKVIGRREGGKIALALDSVAPGDLGVTSSGS